MQALKTVSIGAIEKARMIGTSCEGKVSVVSESRMYDDAINAVMDINSLGLTKKLSKNVKSSFAK